MKKTTFLILVFITFQTAQLKAQVYKRIVGIDSIGYYLNYPPYLHSGFRFTYPNKGVGNREEVRSLYAYYYFPSNFREDCHLYSQFMFTTLKDTSSRSDTTHNLSRTNNVLSINNKEKVFMSNGLVTAYYDGWDTTGRFYYNNNGKIDSELYKSNNYDFKKVTYQYNNLGLLSSKDIEPKNSSTHYYSLYKYNSSGIMTEKTDSVISNSSTYITRYRYKQAGSVKIVNYVFSSGGYDDSMFYNATGLLVLIKNSNTSGNYTTYHYDTSSYLDSVVYNRNGERDVVRLYWETYNPTSGIKDLPLSPEHQIAVYPNPSGGIFNIELKATTSVMTVMNSMGQTILVKEIKQGLNIFDSSGLAKGIYFLCFDEMNECRRIMIE